MDYDCRVRNYPVTGYYLNDEFLGQRRHYLHKQVVAILLHY